MPRMRPAHGGDPLGMGAMGQPIEQLGPDRAAPSAAIRRFNRARLAGNHQNQPRAHTDRLSQPMIEPGMGSVEAVAVQVEREIRADLGLGQLTLP